MGGDREELAQQSAERLGIPIELIMDAEGFGEDETSIYQDNAKAVMVFVDIMTQWRTGAAGAVGLDYNVLPMVFDLRKIEGEERAEVFDGVRVMESAALEAMRKKD